ncbi:MAG: MBL fold metallo-hydrolase, partial [Rhodospirillales bacterium]|nr:MBL fold metallo-hydrolase [Rhodospirillales bacterium]
LKNGVLSARKRMLFNGVVVGSFAMDSNGRLHGTPRLSAPGLLDELEAKQRLAFEQEFHDVLEDLAPSLRQDEAALTDAARAALRRIVGKPLGKRPLVEVHILRV